MLRVRGANVHPQAVAALLGERAELGRYAIVAEGDPIEPPLRILIETTAAEPDLEGIEAKLRRGLGAAVELRPVPPGTLPVSEHKTWLVYRLTDEDALPSAVAGALDRKEHAE